MAKTANPQKNFFQNYLDHLAQLKKDGKTIHQTFFQAPTMHSTGTLISQEILPRLNMFDSLHDKYDYADEYLGATVQPMIAWGFGLATFGLGLYSIYLKFTVLQGQHGNQLHLDQALNQLKACALLFVAIGLASIKSSISIFSRPIMTFIEGWKPTGTKERFCEDASIIEEGINEGRNLFEGVSRFIAPR